MEPGAVSLVHRCRHCGGVVQPTDPVHAVAWCGHCRRVGVARLTVESAPGGPPIAG